MQLFEKVRLCFCSDEKGIVWILVTAYMSFTVCHITFVLVCLTESDAEFGDWLVRFQLLLLKFYCAIYCI